MTYLRRLILALVLSCGLAPVFAQVPAPVPALPDTERRTSYSITATTCACAVNFALYGDSTDYQNWVEVFVNGALVPQSGNWAITSPSGSLANLPRPITDAVLTFTVAQTGTVQIVGARRPRRTAQFAENTGVSARNLNQVFTDIIAQNREIWDKTNDVTGRAVLARPGETIALLPVLASRLNTGACFDGSGNLTTCVSIPASTFAAGTLVSFSGTNPTTINVTPTASAPLFVDPTTKNISCPNCQTTGAVDVRNFAVLPKTSATVCNGSGDDTATIQAAVNAANANLGGTITFPAGACQVSSPGVSFLNMKNVHLIGQGGAGFANSAVTSLIYTSATGSLFVLDGADAIEIDHLAMLYSNGSYNGDLLDLRQVSGASATNQVRIHDCFAAGSGGAGANSIFRIGGDGVGQHAAISTRIDGCILQQATQIIRGEVNANNVYIANNYFNQGSSTSHIGVKGEGWTLLNNTFEPSTGTVSNNITANGALAGLSIIGNTFNDGSTGTPISLTGAAVSGLAIAGNSIQGAAFSINVGSASNVSITGNYVNANNICNVIVSAATNVTVFGNTGAGQTVCTNPAGNFIIDTNVAGGLALSSLTTPPPTTKTANYSMAATDSSLIFNGAGSLTLTLQAASSFPGRWLTVKTIAAQTVVSASSNVVPAVGGAAGTAILAATAGKWARLQSDGTSWIIMEGN